MVVNDNACLLGKRGALEPIVGTPPGASSLLQRYDNTFGFAVDVEVGYEFEGEKKIVADSDSRQAEGARAAAPSP